MDEMTDQLAFVSLDGRPLPHSRAELVQAPWGWQVELHDVPSGSCPLLRQVGRITLETADGQRCHGRAITDLVAGEGTFLLLGGLGTLR